MPGAEVPRLPSVAHADSLVRFRNSQGTEARGTPLQLTRTVLTFEVYNPYSIVQLSEVLQELEIRRGEQLVYRGRAVVSNLVNTGLMLIVSATLLDGWCELSTVLGQPAALGAEVGGFVDDWRSSHRLRPGYQLAVARIRSFLSELSRWLGQLDPLLEEAQRPRPEDLFGDCADRIYPNLSELFANFEQEATAVDEDEKPLHMRYAQMDLHPLIMRAPFVHRTYAKPLGYAGDYEMVNMMLRDPREGQNLYAQLVNAAYLATGPAVAHRNRIGILMERLREVAGRARQQGRRARVLNIGCGPAQEIQRLFREDPEAARALEFELLDFNAETLDYAREQLAEAAAAGGLEPALRFRHESVHGLLKTAARREPPQAPYDLVYCAGLFDYLSDRVCQRLLRLFRAWAGPGGGLLVTNVHPSNPNRGAMEHLLEWHLIYRNERDMERLVQGMGEPRIYCDDSGINVFLECRG